MAQPGTRLYVSNASEAKTYSARLGSSGALEDLKVFAERGGESVTADDSGRVYLANGQIFVYGANGSELGVIEVPERPLQLLSGWPHLVHPDAPLTVFSGSRRAVTLLAPISRTFARCVYS